MLSLREHIYRLDFGYGSGRYDVREEYIIYDQGSFVGDIGGYLGLLLGHSIYSVFCEILEFLKRKQPTK